jgi:hypothetical protein
MSNEITASVSLTCNNGDFKLSFSVSQKIDQAVQGGFDKVVPVGTSEEDLDVTDITTEGLIALVNLHATNVVTLGPKSGGSRVSAIKLKPGEPQLIRMDSTSTWRWSSSGSESRVRVVLLED